MGSRRKAKTQGGWRGGKHIFRNARGCGYNENEKVIARPG